LTAYLAIVVALYGLIIGSFINALVWRLHEKKGIAHGERSECPHCHHALAAKDLVPVLSWLWLRGKCRYCHKPISLQYPAVELITAGLFALSYLRLAPSGTAWFGFIIWLGVASAFVALAVYDLRWLILPDKIVLPLVAFVAAGLMIQAAGFGLSWGTVARHGFAALALGAAFYILASLAGGKLMGGGDVKLGTLMGLILGLRATLLATLLAFNLAALVGIALIIMHLRKRTDYIAFGPFLIIGTIIAYLYGQGIIEWYLRLNGLQ